MRRYRAQVNNIVPSSRHCSDWKQANVFCALSLANPNFYRGKLTALLQFLIDEFAEVRLVTTGYLYRHNYVIGGQMSVDGAIDHARQQDLSYIMNELSENRLLLREGGVVVNTWLDLYVTDAFTESSQAIWELFEEDAAFRASVLEIGSEFLGQRLQSLKNSPLAHDQLRYQHCVQFLLEEYAMIDVLICLGYRVGVYPGLVPPVIESLMDGRLSIPDNPLIQRIHSALTFVTVDFRRVGSRGGASKSKQTSESPDVSFH